MRADSTSSESCQKDVIEADPWHITINFLSAPSKASHFNQQTRARDPTIPFTLPLHLFQKIYPTRQIKAHHNQSSSNNNFMSAPSKVSHFNQQTRARDPTIPFALPLHLFQKIYPTRQIKEHHNQSSSNKPGQPYQGG